MSAKCKADISLEIENVYTKCPELTYLEILTLWADENDLDFSEVPQCINDVLRHKMMHEATSLNMLKKESTQKSSFNLDFLM